MPTRRRTAIRTRRAVRRLGQVPSRDAIERMLIWMARELRAERTFGWYRARRPCAFILAWPPGEN